MKGPGKTLALTGILFAGIMNAQTTVTTQHGENHPRLHFAAENGILIHKKELTPLLGGELEYPLRLGSLGEHDVACAIGLAFEGGRPIPVVTMYQDVFHLGKTHIGAIEEFSFPSKNQEEEQAPNSIPNPNAGHGDPEKEKFHGSFGFKITRELEIFDATVIPNLSVTTGTEHFEPAVGLGISVPLH